MGRSVSSLPHKHRQMSSTLVAATPHMNEWREKERLRMSISERATAQRPQRAERPKPAYIVRAKVGNGWTSIGAMWKLRSGEDGYSLKLTSLPLGWDGRCVALLPLENGEMPDVVQE